MIHIGQLPDLGFIRGNSFRKTISMFTKDQDEVLTPMNLSDFSEIRMDIRSKPNEDGELLARLDLNSGLSVDGGQLTMSLTKKQTNRFKPNASVFTKPVSVKGTSVMYSFNGRYYSDIAFFVGDEVKTLLKVDILVMANITNTEILP
jgi:hypothetical protein